jgi:hypothetical protein
MTDPEHFRHFTPREIDRGDFLYDEMRDRRWEREYERQKEAHYAAKEELSDDERGI